MTNCGNEKAVAYCVLAALHVPAKSEIIIPGKKIDNYDDRAFSFSVQSF